MQKFSASALPFVALMLGAIGVVGQLAAATPQAVPPYNLAFSRPHPA